MRRSGVTRPEVDVRRAMRIRPSFVAVFCLATAAMGVGCSPQESSGPTTSTSSTTTTTTIASNGAITAVCRPRDDDTAGLVYGDGKPSVLIMALLSSSAGSGSLTVSGGSFATHIEPTLMPGQTADASVSFDGTLTSASSGFGFGSLLGFSTPLVTERLTVATDSAPGTFGTNRPVVAAQLAVTSGEMAPVAISIGAAGVVTAPASGAIHYRLAQLDIGVRVNASVPGGVAYIGTIAFACPLDIPVGTTETVS